MVRKSRNEALALSAKLGIGGRHVINCDWYPGDSRKILEDWCAKNCKPAKPAKSVEPVKEVIATEIKKAKREEVKEIDVKSSYYKPSIKNKEKKKVDDTSKPSWNYKNKKKD